MVDPSIDIPGHSIGRCLSSGPEFAAYDCVVDTSQQRRLALVCHTPNTATRRELERFLSIHRRVRSSFHPPIDDVSIDAPRPFVTFRCRARWSADAFWSAVSNLGPTPVDYAAGCALLDEGFAFLEATHAAGVHAGRVHGGNLLYDVTGAMVYLGFGTDIVLTNASTGDGWSFVAPEVAAGRAPSISADLLACAELSRRIVRFIEIPPSFYDPQLGWLRASISFVERTIAYSPLIRQLITPSRLRYVHRRRWRKLGITPRLDNWRTTYQRINDRLDTRQQAGQRARVDAAHTDGLCCAETYHWFRYRDAEPVDLSRRKAPRLILGRLVREHLGGPGRPLAWTELQEFVWPGETLTGNSGKARVQVAISTLRKFGLDCIVYADGGYFLTPDLEVTLSA